VTARYGEPTDAHAREVILRDMSRQRLALLELADRLERKAADAYLSEGQRFDAATRAARHRRQAAHYQQAIDLLTAAPMPPVDPTTA
jgi:hypothetical protein